MLVRFREDYQVLFGRSWPVWVGGVAYGIINVLLFLHFQPWSTLDGVLNWGDNLFGRFGIGIDGALPPLLRSGSVINIGLIMGALLAALLAGQFGIRVGPRRELVKGILGGLLMGVGAVLVRGCNIGGFFSGTSSLGLHGITMALGLTAGAFFGVRYLMWEMEHASAGGAGSKSWLHSAKAQPYVGGLVLLILLAGAFSYARQGYNNLSVILLFGILLGVVSQRSRICFVSAFRDPFLMGKGEHTKAMLLGLVISLVGITLVKYMAYENLDDTVVYAFVRPTFWLGSLVGGVIFGVGMVIAGGCGGGTLWRVGEGHVKLFLALIGYVLSAAFVNDWLVDSGLISKMGSEAFLPDIVGGWAWSIVLLLALLFVWYLIIRWNEVTGHLAALS